MDRQFYRKLRVLLILNFCPICREWIKFIEDVNMNLPLSKQIDVIEVSTYYDYGTIDNPKLSALKKYLTHSYPVFFFDGFRLDTSASREELEVFVKTLIGHEMKIEERNPFLFDKNCKFVKMPFLGKRIACE